VSALLAIAHAIDWTWEMVIKPLMRVLFALCVVIVAGSLLAAVLAALLMMAWLFGGWPLWSVALLVIALVLLCAAVWFA
jgi:hypothetical protein